MTARFTETQKQAIRNGEPVPFQEDGMDCVAVRADIFQCLQDVVDEGLPTDVVTKIVDQTMSEVDANDPLLESYQLHYASAIKRCRSVNL